VCAKKAGVKEGFVKKLVWLAVAGALGVAAAAARPVQAQVSVTVGAPPVCPYGYYDYPPYACAAYGYYGPEWFTGGVFVGAGPWFHGPAHFYGHVDNHFDPRHGYNGPVPNRGDHARPENHLDRMPNFHGNESRDGRGHAR
jgi:hypothetical protein